MNTRPQLTAAVTLAALHGSTVIVISLDHWMILTPFARSWDVRTSLACHC